MKYQDILNLFGYSEFSPKVKDLLPKLFIPLERPEKSVVWRKFKSEKWDFSLVFIRRDLYANEYGPIEKQYIANFDESFLEEVNFGGAGEGINYPYDMPYDLKFGDSVETVEQKLIVKKSGPNGRSLVFNTEHYRIRPFFDDNQKMYALEIRPHEIDFKKKRELTKSFRQQNKNLTTSEVDLLIALKEKSPVLAWTKRMKKGDDNFTIENIEEAKKLLTAFTDNLLIAIEQKKAAAIYSATRKLTQGFNKLNDKYQDFIETSEREELVEYIHKAIRMTGFQVNPELDLTEEWRTW